MTHSPRMSLLRLGVLLVACALSASAPAYAARVQERAVAARPKPPTEKQRALLGRVQAYLNGIDTMTADFLQVSPDGSLASGKFYLKRPGRLRWEYDPPTPILIVADGKFVNVLDHELDEVSKLPIDSTLVSFLAQPTIRFDHGAKVLEVGEESGTVHVTITQTQRPDDGSLTLVLADGPMVLQKMVVRDAVGQTTSVTFNGARFGTPLESRLFVFEDPNLGVKRKK